MNPILRSVLVLVVAMLSYVAFQILFAAVLAGPGMAGVGSLASLVCAIVLARYAWVRAAAPVGGVAGYAVLGAVLIGAVGFVGGFFGPMVFAPGANQGPMLGIFITGPLGFVLGAIGGGFYGAARGRAR